jgi:bacteriocin biosynthesis cyclodehydratase domain-containing protein
LYGDGHLLSSLGGSLLRNGLAELHLGSSGHEIDAAPIDAEIRELETAGVDARFAIHNESLSRVEEYDLVAYGSTRPSLRLILDLNERCIASGTAFLPAITLWQESYLGPMVTQGSGACWRCALLRIAANCSPARAVELWRSISLEEELATSVSVDRSPAAQMLGNNAAFEIFKYRCAHLVPETADGVLIQSLETLESTRRPLFPHPHCHLCGKSTSARKSNIKRNIVRNATGGDASTTNVGSTGLIGKWRQFIHPQLGLLKTLDEESHPQIPLRCAVAVFAVPEGASKQEIVYGFDIETTAGAARVALIEAVRRYSRICPPASTLRFGSFRDLENQGATPVRPDELAPWCGPEVGLDEAGHWLLAHSISDKKSRLVPAGAVYRLSPCNPGCFRRLPPCLVVGDSMESILEQGVSQALAHHRVASFPDGGGILQYGRNSVRQLGKDLEFLLDCLGRFGHTMRMLELCGSTPVRVVLASLGNESTNPGAYAMGFGSTLQAAAKMALLNLVGACQVSMSPQDLGCSVADLAPHFPVSTLLNVPQADPEDRLPRRARSFRSCSWRAAWRCYSSIRRLRM